MTSWNASGTAAALALWLGGALLSGGAVGCDKGGEAGPKEEKPEIKAPEVAKSEQSSDPVAPPAAESEPAEAEPKKSVPQLRREKLGAAALAVYCAQRKDDGADLLAVYTAHGYDSPAAFNEAWEKDAKKNAEWAESTLAGFKPEACGGAPAAGKD